MRKNSIYWRRGARGVSNAHLQFISNSSPIPVIGDVIEIEWSSI
jgi:hypothetical protein